jgi:hypothetical protein
LAELASQGIEDAPVLIVERFGEDDFGGGYRGPRLLEDAEARTVGAEGRPVAIREVVFDAEGVTGGV